MKERVIIESSFMQVTTHHRPYLLLLAMVLAKVKELEYICMPWLKVDSKCPGSLQNGEGQP